MKIAALDLGSNTTLMLICEVIEGAIANVFSDHSAVTRLGQEIDKTGQLHPEALERLDQCLSLYKEILIQENVEKVVAVATSAARDAKNKDDFFKITEKHGIPVKIIPGSEEAEVTFLGSTFDVPDTDGIAVIDVGGGSTEIISRDKDQITGYSLDVGSVRLTERFFTSHPINPKELKKFINFLKIEFEKNSLLLPSPEKIKRVLAVAGTPTTLAMILQKTTFVEDKIHGYEVKHDDLIEWMYKLSEMTVIERQKLVGMNPKRADVIVAGLGILATSLEYLGPKTLSVSTKGVRYGLALKYSSF